METIGSKLKTAREKRNMSHADIAKAVRISTHYVEAIENNEFHKLIAPIYAKGFIKLYCECVQLDPAPFMRQFSALPVMVAPAPSGHKPPLKKEVTVQKRGRDLKAYLSAALDFIRRIKLPEMRRLNIPGLIPLEAPAKKWLGIIVVAAVAAAIILPVIVKKTAAIGAKLRVPAACRLIAEPPEPYLNVPARKMSTGR